MHSQHLHCPADTDLFLFLGKQAKRPLRGLPLALLPGPSLSSSRRYRAAQGALATSNRENATPTAGNTWERKRGDIPNALYSSPLERLGPAPTKAGRRQQEPHGAPQRCQMIKTNLCMCISLYIQHINIYTHTHPVYTRTGTPRALRIEINICRWETGYNRQH